MPLAELEKLIEGLDEENYAAVVKFASYLSEQQKLSASQGSSASRRIGAGKGLFVAPADLDSCNDEVAALFGIS